MITRTFENASNRVHMSLKPHHKNRTVEWSLQ